VFVNCNFINFTNTYFVFGISHPPFLIETKETLSIFTGAPDNRGTEFIIGFMENYQQIA
jgi:hypothetical protein